MGTDHSTLGGTRFISGHTPNSTRQVISSPLAKLSMSSTLEEGGGFVSRALNKRRVSDASMESSKEDSLMESDGESLEESVETATCGPEKT